MRAKSISFALFASLAACAGCGGSTTIDVAKAKGPQADDPASKVVTVASHVGAHAVTVDHDLVYFTTDSSVAVASLSGGAPRVIASGVRPTGVGVAVDGASLFWPSDGGAIGSSSVSGGDVKNAAAGFTGNPLAVVVDATNVYFTTDDGSIAKAPKAGGAVTVLAENQGRPASLAVDDEGVYWASVGTTDTPGAVHKLYKGQSGTENVVTLATAIGTIEGIAIDDTCLFFTDTGVGAIKMVWKDGSHATAMAVNQAWPRSVVKQAATESLFWLVGTPSSSGSASGAAADGAIVSLVNEQGAPVRVAHGFSAAESLAANDHAVVWTMGGSVYALTR